MTNRVLGWLTVSSVLLSSGLAESGSERDRELHLGGPEHSGTAEKQLEPV
jgi:hypothetical protein